MLLYPATIRHDGKSTVVLFPDFPEGGHTNGPSAKEALGYTPDALKTIISMLVEKGFEVPLPSKPSKEFPARLAFRR